MAAMPCHAFAQGACRWGEKCRYKHGEKPKVEVGLGLGSVGSGEGVRVRRRKRSSRRRATAVEVISDDRVMASESLVDGDFEKSHDGPLGRPVCEEGTHLVGTFVAPDLGSSRPGLEDPRSLTWLASLVTLCVTLAC